MNTTRILTAFSAFVSVVSAVGSSCPGDVYIPNPAINYFGGMNMGVWNEDGSCKSAGFWLREFTELSAMMEPVVPRSEMIFKLFSATDCRGLRHAIPAAQATRTKIWVKLWFGRNGVAGYRGEQEGLKTLIREFGSDWLAGISVGSEALHRGEANPGTLAKMVCIAKQTFQVEFQLRTTPVGIADNWNGLSRGDIAPALAAADHIVLNSYPFFGGRDVSTSTDAVIGELEAIRSRTTTASGGYEKVVAIGETGWPTTGSTTGAAVPSVRNLQIYWNTVGCRLIRQRLPWVWFEGRDEPQKTGALGVEPHWGLAFVGLAEKIELHC